MNARLCAPVALSIAAACLVACSQAVVIDVTLTGDLQGLSAFEINAFRAGRQGGPTNQIARRPRFQIELPADTQGSLRLEVNGLSYDPRWGVGCAVARGATQVTVPAAGRYELTPLPLLTLPDGRRGCLLQLYLNGLGTGEVTFEAQQPLTSSDDAADAPAVERQRCLKPTPDGVLCELHFQRYTRLRLSTTEGADSYFAGWGGQCQGRGTCALVMDHGAHGVVANLDPPPVCSQHRWCWEQPRPTGRTLRSLWGDGSGALFAIGDGGTVLRWNGAYWRGVPSGTRVNLRALHGVRTEDGAALFAVGESGTVLRFSGAEQPRFWPLPSVPQGGALRGVWAHSATDLWVVGSGGAFRLLEGQWTPIGSESGLNAVWASSPREVWAVGDEGAVLRWQEGLPLQRFTLAAGQRALNAVWGSGTGDVWVVGEGGAAYRWDGAGWTESQTGALASLNAVWGSGPQDVWAVGNAGTVLHRDGSGWQPRFRDSSLSADLFTLWGARRDDVWLMGLDGVLLNWNGNALAQRSSQDLLKGRELTAISGSGPQDVWAVGTGGLVLRWDGAHWAEVPGIGAQTLTGIWVGGPREACVISSSTGNLRVGALRCWDGAQWSWVNLGSIVNPATGVGGYPPSLNGIWGSRRSDLWVVGAAGLVLHGDGATFAPPAGYQRVAEDLYAVQGVPRAGTTAPAYDVWMVGRQGTALRWDGAQIERLNGDAARGQDLLGVWGSAARDVWLVGGGGTLLHWKDNRFTPLTTEVEGALSAVYGWGLRDVWAAGAHSALLRSDGDAVTPYEAPTASIAAVWGSSSIDAWAVSRVGILKFRP